MGSNEMSSKTVVTAMSGGVDSSVTAVLLKDRGFKVIGITMQIWERSRDWGDYAKKIANKLGIPHYVLDLRDIFKEKVIANFCEEYKQGRTPNPCIRCNKYIKFDSLVKKAKELGADYIATGHYARIQKAKGKGHTLSGTGREKSARRSLGAGGGREEAKIRYLLKKGIDTKKDQSYVLYTMTQEQLQHTLMPLGDLTKDRVKQIAKEKDLSVANRPESQEICFIPDNNYGDFLRKYIPAEGLPEGTEPGPIVNKEGKVIGEHQGIIFYTIGQRKRIGVANKEPLYVITIDKENNTIVVGKKEEGYADELLADNLNFIDIEKLKTPIKVEAKIRYLHQPSAATVIPLGKDRVHPVKSSDITSGEFAIGELFNRVKVKFEQPQWAITPGQAVVFYDKEEVIGGGTIERGKYERMQD